jgi:glycosyltransferase involved in cell wall biosynthesis
MSESKIEMQLPATSLFSCSIVIRCFNEERHIGKLLHGVTEQTVQDVEIVIVDSGSVDGTLSIASRFPVKIVSIKPEEFSFGRSLNLGCAEATNEYIVIASAHVYPVYRDWLEQMLRPFKDPKIGLVYGQQRGGENSKFSEQQIFEKWFPDSSQLAQSHPFCNNANAAIRKSLWEEFRYNEEITGLEDIDFAHRILKTDCKIAYTSQAAICHIHNEVPRQTYNRYRREAIALKRISPDEHFSLSDFLRLFTHNVVSDYLKAMKSGCSSRDLLEIPLFRLMQFWGTFRGFKDSCPVTSHLKKTFYYPNQNRGKMPVKRSKQNHPLLIDYTSGERTFRGNN